MTVTEAAAGWYPDPSGRPDCFRWWDGHGWTRNLADDPSAPDPSHQDLDDVATTGDFDPTAPPTGTPASARISYPPGYRPPHRPARADRGRRPVRGMILGVVGVLVLALAGLGIVVLQQRSESELLFPATGDTTAAASPTPTPAADGVEIDERTRELTIPGLSLTLPLEPYEDVRTGDPLSGLIVNGATNLTVVQEDYRPNRDWAAELLVGQVDEAWVDKNVAATGDALFDRIVEFYYGDHDPTLKKREAKTYTEGYPYPIRIVSADVHFRIKGLDSDYDNVSLLVAPRPDGGFNAWFSRRPNNSDPEVRKALDASIATMSFS